MCLQSLVNTFFPSPMEYRSSSSTTYYYYLRCVAVASRLDCFVQWWFYTVKAQPFLNHLAFSICQGLEIGCHHTREPHSARAYWGVVRNFCFSGWQHPKKEAATAVTVNSEPQRSTFVLTTADYIKNNRSSRVNVPVLCTRN